jgi:hypothetical protein
LKAIGLLVESGAIHPTPPTEVDAGPAQRLNKVLLERFSLEDSLSPLAAPGVGSGIRMNFVDMLALGGAGQRKPDHAATARRGWEMLSRGGLLLQKNGKTLPDQAANEAELVERLQSFDARKAPLFRRLGIV